MKKVLLTGVFAVGLAAAVSAEDMSIEVNPLGFALGIFNGTFLYDVNDTVAVGPTGSYWGLDLSGDSFSILQLGVRGEYMPNTNKTSGLYVAGTGTYTTVSVSATGSDDSVTCDASTSAPLVSGTGGYKYIGGNGFLAKVGVGYAIGSFNSYDGSCSDGSSYSESTSLPIGGLALEWSLGYKF